MSEAEPEATRGRPRRTDWQEPFLKEYKAHGVASWAMRNVKVSRYTVQAERKRDEEFARRYDQAFEESTGILEMRAVQWARSGVPVKRTVTKTHVKSDGTTESWSETTESVEMSPTMLIFLLKARRPGVYGQKVQVEQTGADGGPMVLRVEKDGTMNREIERIMDELAPRREAKAARDAAPGDLAEES